MSRYIRQTTFAGLGSAGQEHLGRSRVLIVGVGGLGSWLAELLTRAGVGFLRLVDDDRVEIMNIHRQGLYNQADATGLRPKVLAAKDRLAAINSATAVETIQERAGRDNAEVLADGADLILDGTDNFATRFIINDVSAKKNIPWVMAGVVRAEGQVLTILPGRTACLRCVYDSPPPEGMELRAANAGVVGPAVAAIASIQACEAIKVLVGAYDSHMPQLLRLDFWNGGVQRMGISRPVDDCPCCRQRIFEFLREDMRGMP